MYIRKVTCLLKRVIFELKFRRINFPVYKRREAYVCHILNFIPIEWIMFARVRKSKDDVNLFTACVYGYPSRTIVGQLFQLKCHWQHMPVPTTRLSGFPLIFDYTSRARTGRERQTELSWKGETRKRRQWHPAIGVRCTDKAAHATLPSSAMIPFHFPFRHVNVPIPLRCVRIMTNNFCASTRIRKINYVRSKRS